MRLDDGCSCMSWFFFNQELPRYATQFWTLILEGSHDSTTTIITRLLHDLPVTRSYSLQHSAWGFRSKLRPTQFHKMIDELEVFTVGP